MALTLAEGLINALKTYIEANKAAKFTALNTEYSDGITLADTVITYVGIKSLKSIPNFPALFLFSPEQRFQARSESGGATKPSVYIGIVEQDMDSEVLQRRLYRYGRAIVELLLASSPGSIAGWAIATDDEWQIDTETGQLTEVGTSDFTGEVSVLVRAYAWEE